jgi:hypothetical protein
MGCRYRSNAKPTAMITTPIDNADASHLGNEVQ